LRLFNSFGKKIENFKALRDKEVGMYTCGPTVYDYGHIGNFRTFVFQDILKKYLKYKGFSVTHVMNITDVDDKTIYGSQKAGSNLKEYTSKYITAFFEDLKTLNIEFADYFPKATEHITEMVDMVKLLLDNGLAYSSEGSIYFDISKFEDYGKLSGLSFSNSNQRSRIKSDEYKKEARDFALWKSWDKSDGDVYWETKIGKGRPGWHIECSAMSSKYLGKTFDIHLGGIDLLFPHHENEKAQSEGSNRSEFVRYWIHSEHLLVEGQKMSKSLGNILTVRDLLDEGYDGRVIRYLLLTAHYREKLNFTYSGLKQSESSLDRLDKFLLRVIEEKEGADNSLASEKIISVKRKFEHSMDNDLNLPEALGVLFEFVREFNKLLDNEEISKENRNRVLETLEDINKVLGIMHFEKKKEVSEEVKTIIEQREEARKKHDWDLSDRLRAKLLEKGIILEDTPDGVKWRTKEDSK